MKHKLKKLKETQSTKISGDFNTALLIADRTTREKKNQ